MLQFPFREQLLHYAVSLHLVPNYALIFCVLVRLSHPDYMCLESRDIVIPPLFLTKHIVGIQGLGCLYELQLLFSHHKLLALSRHSIDIF